MSNCCTCSTEKKKTVLFYSCSGAANVGQISDRAARQLMAEGLGSMFCLAGIGAGIPGMVQTVKDADLNVVLDGCPMDCAKLIFERAGVKNYVQVRLTDLGIPKAKGVPITDEQVVKAVAAAKKALGSS